MNSICDETIMTDPRHTEPTIHETTTEARAGSTPGVARVVLVVGTLLTIVLFTIIVLVGRS
jgi:hypothetical protein